MFTARRRVAGLAVLITLVGSAALASAATRPASTTRAAAPAGAATAAPAATGAPSPPSGPPPEELPPVPLGAYAKLTQAGPSANTTAQPRRIPSGLPAHAAPAARVPEPTLPVPDGWSFGDGFPRTSGAGRYLSGAYFWSDFLYDDHGAIGVGQPPTTNQSAGAPSPATYGYPEPKAHANGADIFRSAVGADATGTWWRVDWNTLDDPKLPIAEWAIDTDANSATGASAWPANAGITSPGIDRALLVSATGAWLIDPVTGTRTDVTKSGGSLAVSLSARSFLVHVPTGLLPVGSKSVVRLASGLANPAGDGFLTLDTAHGARPGQPNVYNVTYRGYDQENPVDNAWFDSAQTSALSGNGDVSAFAATVDWRRLAQRVNEPEPVLNGYTNRWYVSSIELGQGVVSTSQGFSTPEVYLGRVQPYGIYVPSSYHGAAVPLTWILHGSLSNENSSPGVSPRYLRLACEDRGSICVSPLGRGPSGGYTGTAELDVWEVWNRVASAYALDPARTIVSGYSMGGFGTYKFAMEYPDCFAAAVVQAANTQGGDVPGVSSELLPNLRWVPLYDEQGGADELVSPTNTITTENQIDQLGLRYVFDFYPAEDHVATSVKDGFDDAAGYMRTVGTRALAPPTVSLRWLPGAVDAKLGLGPSAAYWLSGLAARRADAAAQVEATSRARPNPAENLVRTQQVRPDATPSPAVRKSLVWQPGAAPATSNEVALDLTNVGQADLDLIGAGVGLGRPATVDVVNDGPVALTLTGLTTNEAVVVDGAPAARSGRSGVVTVELPAGTHTLTLG